MKKVKIDSERVEHLGVYTNSYRYNSKPAAAERIAGYFMGKCMLNTGQRSRKGTSRK